MILCFYSTIVPIARKLKVYSLDIIVVSLLIGGVVLLCYKELQELTFLQLLFYVLYPRNKGGMRYVDDPSGEPYLCLSIQL